MISVKKSRLKRIIAIVIVAVLIFTLLSGVATKIIYDSIFTRYDGDIQTVGYSQKHSFCDLTGYLYEGGGEVLVLLAPGFRAEVGDYMGVIEHLTEKGYGVFAFDPLGHGESGGKSSVGFCREITDIQEAINYVEKRERFGYNDIVLLDYNTNTDFRDISKPISHAGLLKAYIDGTYPIDGVNYQPLTAEEIAAKKSIKKKSNKKSKKQLELF